MWRHACKVEMRQIYLSTTNQPRGRGADTDDQEMHIGNVVFMGKSSENTTLILLSSRSRAWKRGDKLLN